MSAGEKECSHHKGNRNKKFRRIFSGFLIFCFIILVIFLIILAVLQPHKPQFIIQDATIFNFNVSAPNLLSSNLQITVISHNPNDKIGIYYDKLDAYAVYQNQQITYYSSISPVYQGHKDTNVWSPFLYGVDVPIYENNGFALKEDQSTGRIELLIKLDGRVRWKVGEITTLKYNIHVRCLAYINFGSSANEGIFVSSVEKYQIQRRCSVGV
ncbi:NDR1/HIN1-like protein 1 [Impatiens glandulifera]|uniref:NDR1/HIN1-like protein 1 n=1 Tax=Impatiens glandulifera TaxID=253017 RepID=UPI001FB113AD|nr:NDR1/HIN1-like protein 1 [Impatiens glandulifera]